MLFVDFSAFGLGRIFLLGGPGITPAARAAGEYELVVLFEVDREFCCLYLHAPGLYLFKLVLGEILR